VWSRQIRHRSSSTLLPVESHFFGTLLGYWLLPRKIPIDNIEKAKRSFSVYSYLVDLPTSFDSKAISGYTAKMKNNIRTKRSGHSLKLQFFINPLVPIITSNFTKQYDIILVTLKN
jgi:hypothetical protein